MSDDVIELTGGDGSVHRCRLRQVIEHAGAQYALLINLADDSSTVLRMHRDDDDTARFSTIENDKEFDAVVGKLRELARQIDAPARDDRQTIPVAELMPAQLVELIRRSYFIIQSFATGSHEQAWAFDNWLEGNRFDHPGGSVAMGVEYASLPVAEVNLPGHGAIMAWKIAEPGFVLACIFGGTSQYKIHADAPDAPNITDFQEAGA